MPCRGEIIGFAPAFLNKIINFITKSLYGDHHDPACSQRGPDQPHQFLSGENEKAMIAVKL